MSEVITEPERVDRDYIDGFYMSLNSAVSTQDIDISAGAAYVPGTGAIVGKDTVTPLNIPGGANTFQYIYAFDADGLGTAGFEASPIAPKTVYSLFARGKGSTADGNYDATRRYLGYAFKELNGNVLQFFDHPMSRNIVQRQYTVPHDDARLRVFDGTATAAFQTVDVSPTATRAADRMVPISSLMAMLRVSKGTADGCRLGGSPQYAAPAGICPEIMKAAETDLTLPMVALNNNQTLQVQRLGANDVALDLFLYGYYDRR